MIVISSSKRSKIRQHFIMSTCLLALVDMQIGQSGGDQNAVFKHIEVQRRRKEKMTPQNISPPSQIVTDKLRHRER